MKTLCFSLAGIFRISVKPLGAAILLKTAEGPNALPGSFLGIRAARG